jgi:phage terminase large subunit GpA-like protein
MRFFTKLFFPPSPIGTFYRFFVICDRCGETIQGEVNVNNEPSQEFSDRGKSLFTCRKVLIGNKHCFQRIEVVINFDKDRRVLDRKISGGEFVKD